MEIGGWHHSQSGSPEPSVDVEREETIVVLAAFDLFVAESASVVDVLDVGELHQLLDEILLGLGLEAHHVHAHLAAVVPSGEPVPPGVPEVVLVRGPGDPVALAAEVEVAGLPLPLGAQVGHRQADGAVAAGVDLVAVPVAGVRGGGPEPVPDDGVAVDNHVVVVVVGPDSIVVVADEPVVVVHGGGPVVVVGDEAAVVVVVVRNESPVVVVVIADEPAVVVSGVLRAEIVVLAEVVVRPEIVLGDSNSHHGQETHDHQLKKICENGLTYIQFYSTQCFYLMMAHVSRLN